LTRKAKAKAKAFKAKTSKGKAKTKAKAEISWPQAKAKAKQNLRLTSLPIGRCIQLVPATSNRTGGRCVRGQISDHVARDAATTDLPEPRRRAPKRFVPHWPLLHGCTQAA